MNNNNKNKNKLIIIICVLALVCIFAVLVFSGIIDLAKITGGEETTDPYEGFMSDAYTNDIIATESKSLPYLKTDIENIFYTIDTDGTVKFYKLENNVFMQVDASGTYSTSVVLSEMKISADVTYYKSDEKICGYGLYTTSDENAYTLYPYAFFYLRSYGSNYAGSSSSSCMLLVDTTQEDFYSNEKIFEESFTFKFSNSSTSRSISEASRTVGINGAKRDDYFFINDVTVENSVANQLFFSGRYYAESDTKVDIMRTGGSGNNTDNIRVAEDALCYWLHNDGDVLTYISVDDNDNVVIVKHTWSSGNAEIIKTFDGVTKNDIFVSGDYMYVNGKNIVYNLVNNTEVSLAYSKSNALKADNIVADGQNILIKGYVKDAYPVIIVANGETGKITTSYSNDIFANTANPVVLKNGQFMFTTETADGYSYYLF